MTNMQAKYHYGERSFFARSIAYRSWKEKRWLAIYFSRFNDYLECGFKRKKRLKFFTRNANLLHDEKRRSIMLRTYKTYNTITLEYFLNKNFDAIFFTKFFKLLKIRLKIEDGGEKGSLFRLLNRKSEHTKKFIK